MKKINGVMALSAALLAAGVVQASVVVGLDFTEAGATVQSAGGTNVTLSTALESTSPAYMTYIQDGSQQSGTVTLSDGGYTGVYNLSVDIAAVGGVVYRGGTGTLGVGDGLIGDAEELTFSNVVLTFVSGDDKFQFDGFTGIAVANLGTGETFTMTDGSTTLMNTVNGDSNEGNGGFTTTLAWDEAGAPALANTVTVISTTGGNGGSINVLDAQFVAIPEPATLGLVAAFGGGLLFVRRRFMP
jgi:hypothetical protein